MLDEISNAWSFLQTLTLDQYWKLAQILGSVAFFMTSIAAWVTFFFYHRRSMYGPWIESFRTLYAEFWQNERIAKVRGFIVSDIDYETIRSVLVERLAMPKLHNSLTADKNAILEEIDNLCALLGRVEIVRTNALTRKQRLLWEATYGRFWIDKISYREELCEYIEIYWKPILGPLVAKRKKIRERSR